MANPPFLFVSTTNRMQHCKTIIRRHGTGMAEHANNEADCYVVLFRISGTAKRTELEGAGFIYAIVM
jgi:hypothetical protein